MVNKVILVGNLGQDPEVRHLENGSVVGRFSLATNEKYKDKTGETKTITEWHNVVVWRKLAEIAEKYLTKGKMVYVEGKLTHRKWQDKDGADRYTTEVVANNFQILSSKDSSGGSGYTNNFPNANDELPQGKPVPATDGMTAAKTLDSSPKSNTQDPPLADDLPF